MDCCQKKKEKKVQKLPQPMQFCIEDPYKRVKQELIPRHCLTKDEHKDTLATPKFIRQIKNNDTCDDSSKKPVIRKIRTMYPRTDWLSKPTKRRILMTLVYNNKILPAKMLDHLIEVLEAETAITPE
jgi:hypothetical protein